MNNLYNYFFFHYSTFLSGMVADSDKVDPDPDPTLKKNSDPILGKQPRAGSGSDLIFT